MGRRVRWTLLAVLIFVPLWCVGYMVIGFIAELADEASGLRLQYRPLPFNLFTITVAVAALLAALVAALVVRLLATSQPPSPEI